eukprot:scaffold1180_cov321-Prasinococcus_capsulatus_cf.AAC.9
MTHRGALCTGWGHGGRWTSDLRVPWYRLSPPGPIQASRCQPAAKAAIAPRAPRSRPPRASSCTGACFPGSPMTRARLAPRPWPPAGFPPPPRFATGADPGAHRHPPHIDPFNYGIRGDEVLIWGEARPRGARSTRRSEHRSLQRSRRIGGHLSTADGGGRRMEDAVGARGRGQRRPRAGAW